MLMMQLLGYVHCSASDALLFRVRVPAPGLIIFEAERGLLMFGLGHGLCNAEDLNAAGTARVRA